jgi:hypothetical protein
VCVAFEQGRDRLALLLRIGRVLLTLLVRLNYQLDYERQMRQYMEELVRINCSNHHL